MSVKSPQTIKAEDADSSERLVVDQRSKNEAAIRLLRSWREYDKEDRQEQKETWEYLKRVLDEDRLSERKLFP